MRALIVGGQNRVVEFASTPWLEDANGRMKLLFDTAVSRRITSATLLDSPELQTVVRRPPYPMEWK